MGPYLRFIACGKNGRGGVYADKPGRLISLDTWYEAEYGVAGLEMAWGRAPYRDQENLALAILLCAGLDERQATQLAPPFVRAFLRIAPDDWQMTVKEVRGWAACWSLLARSCEWYAETQPRFAPGNN